jgi:hypothetical protein
MSTSRASAPLELVFLDVWGPIIYSFGRKNYCVSFIDDYNKFTWICLLHHKRCPNIFLNFRSSLNECLIARSLLFNLIGEESMRNYTPFSDSLTSPTMSLALILINRMVLSNVSIVILLRWVLLCLPMLLCLSSIGMRHSLLPLFSLIEPPQNYFPFIHQSTNFLARLLIILVFVCLDAHVDPTYIILINFNSDPLSVYSLGIAICTKILNALIFSSVISIYLMMSSSMNMFFHLLPVILMQVHTIIRMCCSYCWG